MLVLSAGTDCFPAFWGAAGTLPTLPDISSVYCLWACISFATKDVPIFQRSGIDLMQLLVEPSGQFVSGFPEAFIAGLCGAAGIAQSNIH